MDFKGFLSDGNDGRNPTSHEIFPAEFDDLSAESNLNLKRRVKAEFKAKPKTNLASFVVSRGFTMIHALQSNHKAHSSPSI